MVQNENPRRRGRPRAYDPETALAQVTTAFWRTGYSGTSLDDLSAATGMNRPSLYGAFGDKRALYLATLDRYVASGRRAMDEALDYERPLPDGLRRFYDRALSLYFPPNAAARGCFLIGTAATEAVVDPEVRARLGGGLREFDRAFEARFRHARSRGELPATVDPAALAKVASAVLHTLALRSRAGDSRGSLRATVAAAVRLMCPPGRRSPASRRRSAAATR